LQRSFSIDADLGTWAVLRHGKRRVRHWKGGHEGLPLLGHEGELTVRYDETFPTFTAKDNHPVKNRYCLWLF
jgi:hypothetical protein